MFIDQTLYVGRPAEKREEREDRCYDLLDRLKPETAKKICHDNILGLVKRY